MKTIIRKILRLCLNNIFINNIAIVFYFENILKQSSSQWKKFRIDRSLTLQENVGFSHRRDVEEALKRTHRDLVETASKYLPENAIILDIGCGTGLYLSEFRNSRYKLHGIDISSQMIDAAKSHLQGVYFYVGDFLKYEFGTKFNLIYSVSVLEYIARTDINRYLRKLYDLLDKNGIIFIHYPHAISFIDTLYPNLNYIKYSPAVVENYASRYFDILSHKHGYDDRIVKKYDKTPYQSVNGTFKNGYLLIARRKV